MSEHEKIYIVMPAYNEARHIGAVIDELREQGFDKLIVVDDGSSDGTANIAQKKDALVVKHMINCGAGAATRTGMDAARKLGAKIVVTFDADGQHVAKNVHTIVDTLRNKKVDVVLGSRFLQKNNIPVVRRALNSLGNFITYILGGVWVSDSQSGMKAFSEKALNTLHIETNGYEFCSEIIRKIGEIGLSFQEVPISVKYSSESLAKGQNFANGIKTGIKLVIRSLMK